MQKDVAKEMRVTPQVVSRLVSAFKNKDHLSHLLWREENASMKVKVVKKIVSEMIEEESIIDSAQSVRWRIEEEIGVDIKSHFIRAVMT